MRGFAALSPEKRREISSIGGKAAQKSGKTHRFTSEEARTAGAKGGAIVAAKGPSYMAGIGRKGGLAVSRDRARMRAIGQKGGFATKRHDTDPCPPMGDEQ